MPGSATSCFHIHLHGHLHTRYPVPMIPHICDGDTDFIMLRALHCDAKKTVGTEFLDFEKWSSVAVVVLFSVLNLAEAPPI